MCRQVGADQAELGSRICAAGMVRYQGAKLGANGIRWSRCIVAAFPGRPAQSAIGPVPAVYGSRQRSPPMPPPPWCWAKAPQLHSNGVSCRTRKWATIVVPLGVTLLTSAFSAGAARQRRWHLGAASPPWGRLWTADRRRSPGMACPVVAACLVARADHVILLAQSWLTLNKAVSYLGLSRRPKVDAGLRRGTGRTGSEVRVSPSGLASWRSRSVNALTISGASKARFLRPTVT
jgi:hypothetical protein